MPTPSALSRTISARQTCLCGAPDWQIEDLCLAVWVSVTTRSVMFDPSGRNGDWEESERWFRDEWLREHPGRTAAEYRRLVKDDASEVWEWRRAKGGAHVEAERQAWERDHPGEECSMTDREYQRLWELTIRSTRIVLRPAGMHSFRQRKLSGSTMGCRI